MYMYVRQSENVYSKVQIQAANLQKLKTIFTDWLIPPFHQSNMQYEVNY